MNKLFNIMFIILSLLLVSCNKRSDDDIINDICDNIINCDSYKSVCTMINNDKTLDIETVYMIGDYYKVTYLNSSGNKQIVLKNDEGVYALTPSLSKQFKFESLWPLNSSHIYMPTSIINDYINDPSNSYIVEDNNIILTSIINHKIHTNYKYQCITIDKSKECISNVAYYDDVDNEVCSVTYSSIIYDISLNKDDFDPTKVINLEIDSFAEGSVSSIVGDLEVSYVLDGSYLVSNNDTIYIYSGLYNYTIICNDVICDEYLGVSRIYDDFMICDKGLIFKNENSYTLIYNNKEVLIISSDIDEVSVINIFDSIMFI